MKMPAHIVWDWNGTLLDDTEACRSAINLLLRERGLPPVSLAAYRRDFGFPVREFYRRIGIVPDDEDWDALARRFHDLYLPQPVRVVPAAHRVVAGLARANIPQSVLSACEQGLLDAQIALHGFGGYFGWVQGSDNLDGGSKLSAGQVLLERLGMAPDGVLLVGDTLHDAEVACRLGCACLLVADGHQSRERLETAGCPVVDDLAGLRELLAGALP